MQPQNITLPEVQSFAQKARFFREGGTNFVEISFLGSKDTCVEKVSPKHMAQFSEAWAAYCDGRPMERRKGTPLTDVGMRPEQAEAYIARNLHTLEELAALQDLQCQQLGHGTLTHREAARKLLAHRQAQQAVQERDAVSAGAATLSAATEAKVEQASGDVAALKEQVATLTAGQDEIKAMLAQLMTQAPKRGPGRPPKAKED